MIAWALVVAISLVANGNRWLRSNINRNFNAGDCHIEVTFHNASKEKERKEKWEKEEE